MSKGLAEKDVLEMRDDVDRLLDHAKAVCFLSRCVAETGQLPADNLAQCMSLACNLITEAGEIVQKIGDIAQGGETVHV